jgi:hypothetical protein
MAPVLHSSSGILACFALPVLARELAWGTQTNWRHDHFGLKSALRRRDFRPGKDGLIK